MNAPRASLGPVHLLLAAAVLAGCGDDTGPGAGGGGGATSSSTSTPSSTAGSGQGGEGSGTECTVDADCKLTIGCCTCGAAPVDEPTDPCEATADCVDSHCSALGIPEDTVAACAAGRCVMGFACDLALVTCDETAPACDEGKTPRVVDGCFSGCVPAVECRPAAP